jgi:hypothetical protein
MGLREEFQKRIDRKQQEIEEIQLKLKEANSYLQALLDTMKLLPKDASVIGTSQILRPGTALAKARDAIKKAGHPLHVSEILKALGKPPDKKYRISLGGSLSGYVRKGEVFTRSAPNTFGLIELGSKPSSLEDGTEIEQEDDLPTSFGKL